MNKLIREDCIYDWEKCTSDPLNPIVKKAINAYLNSIRAALPNNDYDQYLIGEVAGKRALDIGVCEHTLERMMLPTWKHNLIRNNAAYTLGVDIIDNLVAELKTNGVNVVLCDATSERFLGEKFDVIHVGDVIEHVNNPINLLNFCYRHLNENGKIIVRTPNPYHYNYARLNRKYGTDNSNLQHMFYICPIHAMEIVRRCDYCGILGRYLTMYPRGFTYKGIRGFIYRLLNSNIRSAFAEFIEKPESYSTIYVYEFYYR